MPQLRRNSITFDPVTRTFTQQDPPEKQAKVKLTEEDKKRVLEEFRELFGRDPSPDELEDLYIESRKIKQKQRGG